MGNKTGIEWTDSTWNPVVGCSIVSPACTNCCAMSMAARIEAISEGSGKQSHYAGTTQPSKAGPVWTGKMAMAPDHILTAPLRWQRPRKIFVNSMGDLFHESVPDEWIDRVFAVMALAAATKTDSQNVIIGYEALHIFQVLTKRSGRMREYVADLVALTQGNLTDFLDHRLARAAREVSKLCGHPFWMNAPFSVWGWITAGMPGLWLGVTAEDQTRADERIPDLLATPAAKRFVSIEPMLGPVDLRRIAETTGFHFNGLTEKIGISFRGKRLDWVIAGGESGPRARPSHPDWFRSLRDQCSAAEVPFFFKQFGEWAPHNPTAGGDLSGDLRRGFVRHICADRENDGHYRKGDVYMARVGKRRAGSMLDTREHKEFPA